MIFINAEANSKIHIGRAGEHLTTTVVFDITEWLEQFSNLGTTTVNLIIEQNSLCYMQETEVVGNEIHWKVTKSNTAEPGIGKCELFLLGEEDYVLLDKKPYDWDTNWAAYYALEEDRYVPIVAESAPQWEDNKYYNGLRPVVKSAIYEIIVTNALGYNEEEPPGPYESWVDNVLDASANVKQAVVDAKANADRASALAAQAADNAAQTAQNASDTVKAKEAAQTAQRLAEEAQRAAVAAQAAAETAATDAAGAKQGAETAQKAAGGAANAAAKSAQDASDSASAASTSSTNAKASETAAKASETAAKASETAAKASETAAAGSASAATNSAELASTAASAASESASSAASSASSAASSEINAMNAESNAKIYRDDALKAKTAAAESASDAANSASTASSKASDAVKSASSAADSASSANIAMTAAQNAQKAAEEARDEAKQYIGNPPIPDENTKTWWVYDPEDSTANENGYVNTNMPYDFHIDYIVKNQSELATITGMKIGDIAAIQAAISDPMNAQLYMYSGNDSSNGWEFLLDLSGATGNGISSISKTSSTPNEQGNIVDTYTITYTLSDPTTFTVVNGKDGADGIGSGDMLKKDYDQDEVVKTAGGIVKYVENQIKESGTGVVWKKWISTDMI